MNEGIFRTLAETSGDVTIAVDRTLAVRYGNHFAAVLFGCEPDGLLGKRLDELFPPDACQRMMGNLRQAFDTGEPLCVEEPFAFPQRTVWLESRLLPVRDAEGAVSAVFVLSRDCTGRRQAAQQLRHHIEFEEVVSRIAAEFVTVHVENTDAAIDSALEAIGEHVGSDRGYVFLYTADGQTMSNTHEWCAPGIEPQRDDLQDLPTDLFPWSLERLRRGETIHIKQVADLPPEAAAEKKSLEAQDIQSLVLVPMSYEGSPVGFLGLDAVQATRQWTLADVTLLATVGSLLVSVLQRRRALAEVEHRAEFQRLVATISSEFINLPSPDIDRAITQALGQIGQSARADRSYAFCFAEDLANVSCTHEWCADGVLPAIDALQEVPIERFPWALEQHRCGRIVDVPSVRDLPPEARRWQTELLQEGVQSLLCVPMSIGGRVIGFVGLDAVREERRWSSDVTALLRIIGEIFANALERQRGEERLRLLSSAVAQSTEGIAIADLKGNILFLNNAFAEMHGYAPAELMGKHLSVFHTPEQMPAVDAANRQILATGKFVGELWRVRRDGSVFPSRMHNTLLRDEAGEPAGMIGAMRDITERQRAEEALRQSEERYRAITDSAQDSIFVKDADRRYTFCNPAMERALGLPADQIIGKTPEEVFDAESAAAIREVDERNLAGEVVNAVRTLHTGGQEMTFHTVQVPLRDEKGSVTGATGIVRDVTAQRRVEEALRLSEAQYRTTLDSLADALHVVDRHLRILLINGVFSEWCRQLGLPTDLIGKTVSEAFPFLPERVRDEYRSVFETGQLVCTTEETHLGDSTLTTETRKIPILEGDRVVRVITIVRDITQQRRAEEELRRAERLESLGLLAGGIAHDFNNMLMGIMASVSLARLDRSTSRDVTHLLHDAEKAIVRAKGLTQQLLTFSKGGAPVRRLASIADLVRDTTEFALAGANVRCQYRMPDGLWTADVDSAQISQVVQNLVINATQAMPQGGVIEVSAENLTLSAQDGERPAGRVYAAGQYVKVAVRDSGGGITPENLPRIFDPYFTTKGTGSGLGLAVCHSIVRHHDGHIRVDSQPGAGSVFEVFLPASGRAAPAPPPTSAAVPVGHGRILLMDDEAMILRGAGLMLEKVGYTVQRACDGAEAAALYAAALEGGQRFDAVVLDLTVPAGMGGRECLTKLRQLDPDVRAIVSSGYSEAPIMAAFRDHGFRGVVRKPYTLEELVEALHDAMRD